MRFPDDLIERDGADIRSAAVVGVIAVIAHDEYIAVGNGVASVYGAFAVYEDVDSPVPVACIFGFIYPLTVHFHISVCDADRFAANGNNAFNEAFIAIGEMHDNDVTALRLGKPVAHLFNENPFIVDERRYH